MIAAGILAATSIIAGLIITFVIKQPPTPKAIAVFWVGVAVGSIASFVGATML